MSSQKVARSPQQQRTDDLPRLLKQYGCGPVEFTGADDALYERHLLFDHVVNVKAADVRERYEAFARSVREMCSRSAGSTPRTPTSAKTRSGSTTVSMEFLIGRSLANNVTNLLLDSIRHAGRQKERS